MHPSAARWRRLPWVGAARGGAVFHSEQGNVSNDHRDDPFGESSDGDAERDERDGTEEFTAGDAGNDAGDSGAGGIDAGGGDVAGGDTGGDMGGDMGGDDEGFGPNFGDFEDVFEDSEGLQLDERESELVRQDLTDLADFESAFRAEGFRGVAVWCQDCSEEHYYPWDMLRENLQLLIETGETPVHEPAFAPEPDRYIPWDYARGYVDALRDAGLDQRLDVGSCPRCSLDLVGEVAQANYCPRCAAPLLVVRLRMALLAHGIRADQTDAILRATGLPG